ncbi:MAG: ATP-binding cassette domain-containing protein [Pararobbsia sp.]
MCPSRPRSCSCRRSATFPIDTLKAALAYPSEVTEFTDDAYRAALRAVQLGDYVDRLDESAHWTHRMSPGEQQRLAAARVLLQKPDFVFLDEADQLARFGDRAAPLRNDAAGVAAGRDRQRRAPRFARYLSLGDDPHRARGELNPLDRLRFVST